MKKIVFMLLFSLMSLHTSYADDYDYDEEWEWNIDFSLVRTGSTHGGRPKAPIRKPHASYNIGSHILHFSEFHPAYTLRLLKDGAEVFSTGVGANTTELVLPSSLSGAYEIQLIQGNFIFLGHISFY